MLTSKTFIKKTKRGKILKIVREHYLRDDIACGIEECRICDTKTEATPLCRTPKSDSEICNIPHFLIPDTNVVIHQIDVLEDNVIKNVIILQTVLDEVRHRSPPSYKRLKEILSNADKHFYSFCNEFNKDTHIERLPKESSNDRNDRAIRMATKWYGDHLKDLKKDAAAVLLTNDVANCDKAKHEGLNAYSIDEYIRSLTSSVGLVDKLANFKGSKQQGSDKIQFPEHLALSVIQRGLKSGKYLQGSFQASRENYLEANVHVHDQDKSVFLQGYKYLNRAVQDDIVAIEMFSEAQWSCPSSLVLEENADEKIPDDEVDNEDMESRNKVPKTMRQPTGRVVGIIKRNWRQYCGILQKSHLKEATRHLFVAAEKRIPKIRIETRQGAELMSQRIVVAIDNWPRHSRYPQGHFVRKLGNIGDKDTENEVLLLEHDVPHCEFSDTVLSFLPKVPWSITENDMRFRQDLRHIDVCSVDPPGCTDIDDALHCVKQDNGNYQIGVHIADVSHFIRPGNALDAEAARRGTTVYLTDKRIDMVPELLSSNLCSLRDDGDRLAFSVLWEINEDAEIVDTKFTKSVIRSKASLTYAEAQMRIDDPDSHDTISHSLRGLNKLAKKLKKKRIAKGALTLASQEVRFRIDSETHDPIDVATKELMDTNSMVEEFMLLANISVAQKICDEFPNCALLRRHPSPPPSNFDPLLKAASRMGFQIDVSCGKNLADSLNAAVIEDNPYFNTLMRIMTTRCMMQAVYFASGTLPESEFLHYGLATPIYTHFTSPIRRFSDIVVHRLLAVCIGADASYPDLLNKYKTQSCCHNLNYRHKMAQYAGRASVNLHTHLFFKNRIVDEQGYILFIRKNALQVLIPKYGLEATLYLSDGGKKSKDIFVYNEEEATQSCEGFILRSFDPVTVQLYIDRSNVQHLKLGLKLVKPEIPGFSVPPAPEVMDTDEPPTKKVKK